MTFAQSVDSLWGDRELPDCEEVFSMLLSDVVHNESAIRQAAAEALAVALKKYPSHVPDILQSLLQVYEVKLEVSPFIIILHLL